MAVNKKKTKDVAIYFSIFLVVILGILLTLNMNVKEVRPQYYQILELFEQNRVDSYSIDFGTGDLVMTLKQGETFRPQGDAPADTEKPQESSSLFPQLIPQKQPATDAAGAKLPQKVSYKLANILFFREDIAPIIEAHNAQYPNDLIEQDYIQAKETGILWQAIMFLFPIGLIVVLWYFMMRQAGGGTGKAMSFAKVKVKSDDGRKTTFNDVAGAEEEKEELCEVVEFLKSPRRFNELGARIPKGVLLVGPPGTGKTLLARAVAGEAGVPFFSISGSDFVEMFVGVGASRVRDLFEQAKKNAPSIIFIDEIDAVGRQRGAGLGGGHDEREQTLNQLLVEMDGFGANTGVIVIAATNRSDILDHALLRPGRFDRQVVVGYPDVKGREEILKVHTRNKPMGPDVDLRVIAQTTVGFTGADLENLANEAALLAARRGKKAITMLEIEEATIKVVAGPEKKSHKVSERDKKLTSYHEAGHAIAHYSLPTQDPVHQVSIIPRGMAGGYTMALPVEDENYKTKRWMQENIVTLLGGRVAEKLVLDDISTGASNDIERATKLARNMVTRYGFSEKLGPIVYGTDDSEVFLGRDFGQTRNYSENVAAEIDSEVREIIEAAYETCKDILTAHLDQMHKVAKYLMRYEKIDGVIFNRLMEDPTFPDAAHEREMEEHARKANALEEATRKKAAEARMHRLDDQAATTLAAQDSTDAANVLAEQSSAAPDAASAAPDAASATPDAASATPDAASATPDATQEEAPSQEDKPNEKQ